MFVFDGCEWAPGAGLPTIAGALLERNDGAVPVGTSGSASSEITMPITAGRGYLILIESQTADCGIATPWITVDW
jgi:hypothetical protein